MSAFGRLAFAGDGMAWGRAALRQPLLLRDEIVRRLTLVRQPHPDGVRTPPLRFLLDEFRSLRRRPLKKLPGPALRPQPVMVLPGFGSHNKRMKPLFDGLVAAGHTVEGWGLGFNFGPTQDRFDYLLQRVEAFSREQGGPVALVGWSLGGVFAREIARRIPHCVSRVITMGSPFSGDMRANHGWRAYELITGHPVTSPPIECAPSEKPPVPTIALWSPRDGVVHPRAACGWPHERDRAVALRCTHMGFAGEQSVVAEVLRQLDMED